jgi:hypothetical protein
MDVNNNPNQTLPRNLFTVKGRERCPFDMFYRYRPDVKRKTGVPEANCRRGDKFPSDKENYQFLQSCLRYLIKDFCLWKHAEIYDNRIAYDDEDRKILVWSNGVVVKNRLEFYAPMLKDFPLPGWLK